MNTFIIYRLDTGRVVQSCNGHDAPEITDAQLTLLELPGEVRLMGEAWVADGQLHTRPIQPSQAHEWDWQLKTWTANLALAKQQQWARIKTERDEREAAGFPYLGKVFDSDQRSHSRITTAAQAAQAALDAGQPFSIDWTTADNTVITLDAQQMLGVPVAFAQFGNALHQSARSLREQIDAATTVEQVQAIVWPSA